MTFKCFTGYFITLAACSTIAFSNFCSAPSAAEITETAPITTIAAAPHTPHHRAHLTPRLFVQNFIVKARRVAEAAEIVPRFDHAL